MVYHQCGAGSGCHHKITGIIGTAERKDTIAKDMNGQKIPEDKPPEFFFTCNLPGSGNVFYIRRLSLSYIGKIADILYWQWGKGRCVL